MATDVSFFLSLYYSLTLLLSYSLSLSLSLSLSHTHTLSLSLSLTLSYTLLLSLAVRVFFSEGKGLCVTSLRLGLRVELGPVSLDVSSRGHSADALDQLACSPTVPVFHS